MHTKKGQKVMQLETKILKSIYFIQQNNIRRAEDNKRQIYCGIDHLYIYQPNQLKPKPYLPLLTNFEAATFT